MSFRWPWMTKNTHDKIVQAYNERLDAAIRAITTERERATRDGLAKVHKFMVDANAACYGKEGTAMYVPSVRAVFQQAEREFRPTPLTFSERLHGPDNLQEAIDATASIR